MKDENDNGLFGLFLFIAASFSLLVLITCYQWMSVSDRQITHANLNCKYGVEYIYADGDFDCKEQLIKDGK
jgi:hypothetical protein